MNTSPGSLRKVISDAAEEHGTIAITWGDGHSSRFHFIWLRDNCECSECGHGWAKKFVKVVDIPADVAPQHIQVVDGGHLEVTWSGGHVSTYQPGWLRDHCYSGAERAKRRHQPNLWDASLGANLPSVTFADVQASKQGVLTMLEQARDYGFSIVRNLPVEMGTA